jgi:phasin family protein
VPKEVVAKAAPAKIEPAIKAAPAESRMPTPAATTIPVAPTPVSQPIMAASVPEPRPPVISTGPSDKISKTTTDAAPVIAVAPAAPTKPTKPSLTPKPSLTQGMKTRMKSTEDFVAFSQANLEAFVKSGQIWSAGVQELTKQMATSAKATFEESVSTFKAISTAKSVKEAMDLQSTFAKAALEKAMAESNKLTDASIKLTEQTLAPITARVTVAVETFGKAA